MTIRPPAAAPAPPVDDQPTRSPVNMRKARAGRYILEGLSTGAALRKAGYAESTSRKPTGNNLTAEHCLRELSALDPSADPMTMLSEARRAGLRAVRALLSLPADQVLDGKNVGAVTKLWETAEKYHGRGAQAPQGAAVAVSFAERAVELAMLIDELRSRGQLAAPAAAVVVDVTHRPVRHGEAADEPDGHADLAQ